MTFMEFLTEISMQDLAHEYDEKEASKGLVGKPKSKEKTPPEFRGVAKSKTLNLAQIKSALEKIADGYGVTDCTMEIDIPKGSAVGRVLIGKNGKSKDHYFAIQNKSGRDDPRGEYIQFLGKKIKIATGIIQSS